MVKKATEFHGFAIDNPHSIPTELMPKIARKFKTVPEMIWRVRCEVFDEIVSGRKIPNGLVNNLAQYFTAAGYIREDLTADAFVINRLYKAASYGTNLGIPICVQDLLNVYDCNADLYVRANRRYENYESPTNEQRRRIADFIKKSLCDQLSKRRGMSDCYDVLNLRFGLEPGVWPHICKEIFIQRVGIQIRTHQKDKGRPGTPTPRSHQRHPVRYHIPSQTHRGRRDRQIPLQRRLANRTRGCDHHRQRRRKIFQTLPSQRQGTIRL